MTPFGAKVRQLRCERNVTLKAMAEALNVSPAYLSALELGKRGVPTWFMVQRIIAFFNVIWDEAEELQRLAEMSDPRVVVDTSGLEPEATELANLLAARIRGLSKASLKDLTHRLRTAAAKDGA